jgi:hypothetical protein
VKARELTLIDETGRQVMVTKSWRWNVLCIDVPDDYVCKAKILGYDTRTQAIHGAEGHLRWHVNGKPECRECGAWLNRKGAKRCRNRQACEASQ